MAPLRYLPTARDVATATATATTSDSAFPASSSSPSFFDGPAPHLFPSWVGFLGIALLACGIIATCYSAYRQSVDRQTNTAKAKNSAAAKKRRSTSTSNSRESLVKGRMPQPVIAMPAPAYTAAADNAAPGSEAAVARFAASNTPKNERRAVQLVEQPSMGEMSLPLILRPPGARW
ncbi:hypothetical protein FB451DRAFT_1410958 [Mycena latifolia]|nr:hypothetical protein FB451DRAFT_1410958 [Mycena latifolia]